MFTRHAMYTKTKTLWSFRHFITSNIVRDFKSRYANSLLGGAWTLLTPLAQIIIYTVIFSKIMHARVPGIDNTFSYGIYLCSGIIVWSFFTELVQRGQTLFLDQATLIKKINFPKTALPIILLGQATLNLCTLCGLFLLFLILIDAFPGWALVSFIPVLGTTAIVGLGVGISLAVLNVFFRDVAQLMNIVLQFWFWLTPIVYPVDMLPDYLSSLIQLNPLFGVIECSHQIFVEHITPQWLLVLWPGLFGLMSCLTALSLYRRQLNDMIDEL
jgi:lipopolysaccharide transport system permease protein